MPGVNPPNSEFLFALIGDLQKQIRALASQQQLAFTNAQGEVVVSTGLIPGTTEYGIIGYDGANGHAVFGEFDTTIPDGSGRRQTITALWRDDASLALACADFGTVLNHPHQQALQWYDRSGNTVISDDTVSGTGVARPHIPAFGLVNTNVATWPSTNQTTSTQIAAGIMEYQQPKIYFAIELYAPANVTGNFYLKYNGTTIANYSLAGGSSGAFYAWSGTVAVPSGLTFGGVYTLELDALVAAGTGTVSAQPYLVQGVGS